MVRVKSVFNRSVRVKSVLNITLNKVLQEANKNKLRCIWAFLSTQQGNISNIKFPDSSPSV